MDSPSELGDSKAPNAISLHLVGPPFLRYYPAHRLVTWQPHGTLDDPMLDQIAAWLVAVEKGFILYKRFIDLSQLTEVRSAPTIFLNLRGTERSNSPERRLFALRYFVKSGSVSP